MKKYNQAHLRIIDLTSEGVVADSLNSMTVDRSDQNGVTTEWTERKGSIWEDEGIWK